MNLYFPADSSFHQSASQSGNWLLQSGRAITLSPAAGGHLSVSSGQLWATLGDNGRKLRRAPRLARCATLQDYFLNAGDKLAVPPGARLVIETVGRAHAAPTRFAWSVAPQPARQIERASVVQAASELGVAVAQVARALRRLVGAVLVGAKPEQRLETCL